MSTRRLADVIVVGGRTGPLAAACLLARRGYKVLHVEHEGLAGGYKEAGLRLPLEPELLPGPRSSPVVEHVLEALALTTDAQRLLRPFEPELQVLTPGHRFELPDEKGHRTRELVREFGEDGRALAAAVDALVARDDELDPFLRALPPLPPDGFGERRTARKAASGTPLKQPAPVPSAADPVGAAVDALGRLSTFLAAPEPSPLHAVRAGARLLRGVHRVVDHTVPSAGYAGLLRKRLRELGGELLGNGGAVAEEIVVEKGRVAGLRLAGDSADYRCRFLVSGVHAAALRRLIPLEGRRRRYDSTLDSVRPRSILFTVNVVLAKAGWPIGLGDAAVYVTDPRQPLEEDNVLYLQRFPALEGDRPLEDKVVLQASCFMAASRRELGDEYLEGLQARVVERLKADLLPFLDKHLVAVSSPFLTRGGPVRSGRLLPHAHFETDLSTPYGVGVLSPKTPYKNLVLAGREVVPGLGVEGEFLAGLRALNVVTGGARRHDPLKDQ